MAIMRGTSYQLTKRFVEGLPLAERDASGRVQQRLYWDSRDRGFGVLVGLRTKTFVAQRAVNGKTVRVTIGKFGPHDYAVDEARRLAAEELQKLRGGLDDRATRRVRRKLTLADAIDAYEEKLRHDKRSESTITQYRYALEKYLPDWLDRPLATLTQAEIGERHARLVREVASGKHGKRGRNPGNRTGETTANVVMKIFGVVFKRAADDENELTEQPLKKVSWVRTKTARKAIPDAKLKAWHDGVMALDNGVQRDALLFLLFTGMRKQSVLEMRWEDVDLANRMLRVPNPKGGAAKAFDLPLSDSLVELLERRQREHALITAGRPRCSPWVFPATLGKSGHLITCQPEVKGVDYVVHDLRRTFVTKAEALDVSLFAIKGLVNHALPKGDVTAGYVTHSAERLRAPMQRITDALLAVIKGGATVTPIRRKKT